MNIRYTVQIITITNFANKRKIFQFLILMNLMLVTFTNNYEIILQTSKYCPFTNTLAILYIYILEYFQNWCEASLYILQTFNHNLLNFIILFSCLFSFMGIHNNRYETWRVRSLRNQMSIYIHFLSNPQKDDGTINQTHYKISLRMWKAICSKFPTSIVEWKCVTSLKQQLTNYSTCIIMYLKKKCFCISLSILLSSSHLHSNEYRPKSRPKSNNLTRNKGRI